MAWHMLIEIIMNHDGGCAPVGLVDVNIAAPTAESCNVCTMMESYLFSGIGFEV
jgi:hypothetical protein